MTLRIRIARSAIESFRDVGTGVLVGLALALFVLVWVVGPRVVEWSPRLANLLRG